MLDVGTIFGQSTAGRLALFWDSPRPKFKGLFLESPGLNVGTIFGQSETKISGLLWAVLGLILD